MSFHSVQTEAQALALVSMPLPALMAQATALREAAFGRGIELCAIINARSGHCTMDCGFCAQSRRSQVDVPAFPLLSDDLLEERIAALAATPVAHIGLVTSGGALGRADVARVTALIARQPAEIRARLCTSLGRLQAPALQALHGAGLRRYHHNLECARSFYPRICTTQQWDDRRRTVALAMREGLKVCCGGLFGLGEGWPERIAFAFSLRELGVENVPLNFLHPHPHTPLGARPPMPPDEALRIIALFRHILPQATLRVCGGRVTTFGDAEEALFAAGANAIMTGDFLTTCGQALAHDLALLQRLGLEVTACTACAGTKAV